MGDRPPGRSACLVPLAWRAAGRARELGSDARRAPPPVERVSHRALPHAPSPLRLASRSKEGPNPSPAPRPATPLNSPLPSQERAEGPRDVDQPPLTCCCPAMSPLDPLRGFPTVRSRPSATLWGRPSPPAG